MEGDVVKVKKNIENLISQQPYFRVSKIIIFAVDFIVKFSIKNVSILYKKNKIKNT